MQGSDFDAVVFAGGGCRCFWQMGFWSVAAPALGIEPRVVSAVSAGSAFACSALLGMTEPILADFKRRVHANQRNFYPGNLFRGRPLFPQEAIYRGTILDNLDQETLERLHDGPDIRILLARLPGWLGRRSGYLAAVLAYQLDRMANKSVHAQWGRRLGFRGEVVSVRECQTPEQLADLILHSSCTPPVTPYYRRGSQAVLDGGLLDNAPVAAVGEARQALILLTRFVPSERVPSHPQRTYVAPSRPIVVTLWDYTSPELVQDTYDLGRRDGEAFARANGAI